jgi:hypothetical protein
MKILFITNPYPNYVPDLLLHGLRKLLGPDVVDYPRKDCLYEGILGVGICPEELRCPGWFPDDDGQIDRTDVWLKVKKQEFDLAITDFRAVPELLKHLGTWPKRCVIIDGEDKPQKIPASHVVICRRETDGSDFSIPLPMALPVEIFNWIQQYDSLPKQYSIGFLGSTHDGMRKKMTESLARYYPDTLFQASDIPNDDNPLPRGRFGRDEYYQKLQQCRIVLTLAGYGWDTFRFWENAACHALHVTQRMPLYIPNDFVENQEIIRFDSLDMLQRKIDQVMDNRQRYQQLIRQGRQKLLNAHTTLHRAKYLMDRLIRTFEQP